MPRFLRGLFRSREAQPPAPAGGEDSATDGAAASAGATAIAPAIRPVEGRRPRILVVDDDPVILKTIGIKLSRAGCEVITGQDGSEAVTTARKEKPDVIVLDVNFPAEVALAWDGIGVMKWLQRLENGETPPVIIITALGNDQIRQKAMAAGAIAFFQKPIDNEGLIQAINKTLDLRRTSGQPPKSAEFAI